jgi:N-acetylmuramoyl-L-alanine amidase
MNFGMTDVPSPNQDERPCAIDMLVLHYTGMQSCQAAVERLCDPAAKVSSHYVVDEDGTVYRLVPEARRAFHAGVSYWRGRRVLNDPSIGIEIVNPGHEWGYRPFPPEQMAAVRKLCLGILSRHAIPAGNVVGHSDIAPTRKQDPGELFDWRGLAEAGIGLWPGEAGDDPKDVPAALRGIGYEFGSTADLIAFQRHWAPESPLGEADPLTLGRIGALRRVMQAAADI